MATKKSPLKKFVPWQSAPKKSAPTRNPADFAGWESHREMGTWVYSRTWAGHHVAVEETPDPPRSGLYRYRVLVDDKRLGKQDFRKVKQVFAAITKRLGPLRRNPSRNPKIDPTTLKKAATMIRTGKLDTATVSKIAAAVKVPKSASRQTIAKKVNAVATKVAVATASSVGVPEPVTRMALKVSTAIQTAPFRAARWAVRKVRGKSRDQSLRDGTTRQAVSRSKTNHNAKQRPSKNPVWSSAYINRLPDSAFLLIEKGGHKDETGRTTPRSLRHLPVRDMQGRVSEAHARNALSRAPQLKVPGLTVKDIRTIQEKARKLLFFEPAKAGIAALKQPLPKHRAAANPSTAQLVDSFRKKYPIGSDLYSRVYLKRFVTWAKQRKLSERAANEAWHKLFHAWDYDAFADAWWRASMGKKNPKRQTTRNASKIAPHMWVISKDSTGKYIVTIGDPMLASSTLKRRFSSKADLLDWTKYDMPSAVSPTHIIDRTGLGLLKGKKNPKRPTPTKAQLTTLAREFRSARKTAADHDPRAALAKCIVNSTVHVSPRAFAMTHVSTRKIEVHVAPELALEPISVIRGVIRHEYGHVLAALTKKGAKSKAYDAIERHADKIAEKVFKSKIYYDKRGVETTSSTGTRPRPAGLR